MEISQLHCCGIHEFDGLYEADDAKEVLEFICKEWFPTWNTQKGSGAYIVFSDIGEGVEVKDIARLISKYKLGTVSKPRPKVNPNSNNTLEVLLWAVSAQAFYRWGRKKGIIKALPKNDD